MSANYKKLGEIVELIDERNKSLESSEVLGISIDKEFMPSVANTIGTDLSNYKLLRMNTFACNPMHVGRDERLPVSLYKKDIPAIVSPAYFMFRVKDEKKVMPDFLMLIFKRDDFDRNCWFRTDGSVRGGITWNDICEIEFPVPDLKEQEKIVNTYNAITKRIQLKQKINENLEKTAQCLFEKLIVQNEELSFSESIDDNIEFINGLPLQNYRPIEKEKFYPVLKIRELTQGFCDLNSELCTQELPESAIIKKGDLVFSWSGTLQTDFWCDVDSGLNQHLFKVTSSKYPLWFCYLWTKYYLLQFQRIAKNKGTTFGHIKREDLHNSKIKICDFSHLSKIINPLIQQKIRNGIEMRNLSRLQEIVISNISGM